jgi:hypothetical protein
MAEIINLRRARKEKARDERKNEADTNRLRFGRTRAQKAADRDEEARRHRTLDGKRLTRQPGDEDA